MLPLFTRSSFCFYKTTFIPLTLVLVCEPTWAISFLTFDARSMAMGGTGVVTARSHNASLFNPALLTNQDENRQYRLSAHSYIGARLLDRDNFLERADQFAKRYDKLSIDDLLGDVDLDRDGFESGSDLRGVTARVRELQTDMNGLSNKPLRVSASYGAAFNYPGKRWAVGGYHREFLVLGSTVRVADRDNANIDRVTSTVDRFADVFDEVANMNDRYRSPEELTLADVVAQADRLWRSVDALDQYLDFDRLYDDVRADDLSGRDLKSYLREPLPDEFFSTIESRGAEVREQAISVGRRFDIEGDYQLHLGVNLKQMRFTTIHFEQRVDEFELSAYDSPLHRRVYTRFNMDAGFVYNLPNAWEWGLAVRNLIPHDFYTTEGDLVELRPVARVGLGYRARRFRLSMDLDVTKNEPLGFDPNKQYVSFGTELFLWRNTALRAGLRSNIVDGETLPSVGLGFGGHRGHFDFALAKSTNGDEWGLSFQAGLSFP